MAKKDIKSITKRKKKDPIPVGQEIIPKEIIQKAIDNLGRPSKYEKSMCLDVIGVMKDGRSKECAATLMGIHRTTFFDWINEEHPTYKADFAYSVKVGEYLSELWWKEVGRSNLPNPQFNVGLYTLHMANRFGWSRKDRLEVKGHIIDEQKRTIEVNFNYTTEEFKEIMAGLASHGVLDHDMSDSDTEAH